MRKLTFTNEEGSFKTTLECSPWSLYDALRNVEKFLKSCGYEFDGKLEVVKTDKHPYNQWQDYNPTSMTHSNGLTVSQISTLTTNAKDSQWAGINQHPTMAPLTTADIRALTTADLSAFTLPSSSLEAIKPINLTDLNYSYKATL